MPMDLVKIGVAGLTAGDVTASHNTMGDDGIGGGTPTDAVQYLVINQLSTGDFTVTVDTGCSVRLGELSEASISISGRREPWWGIRCDLPSFAIVTEGFQSDISLTHVANHYIMRLLQEIRGATQEADKGTGKAGERRVWVRVENRGPVIAGATPSQYVLREDMCLYLHPPQELRDENKLLGAQFGGVLALDSNFRESTPGTWDVPGFFDAVLINRQDTLMA
jgi:hypothetical protein